MDYLIQVGFVLLGGAIALVPILILGTILNNDWSKIKRTDY